MTTPLQCCLRPVWTCLCPTLISAPFSCLTTEIGGPGVVNRESPALQDYISLFPLDDMQPSKLMRLLSSNEEDANILCSPSECVTAHAGLQSPGQASWPTVQRGGGKSVPRGLLLCFLPTESPKAAVDLPLRAEALLPGPCPSLGHTVVPSPPLTYHKAGG